MFRTSQQQNIQQILVSRRSREKNWERDGNFRFHPRSSLQIGVEVFRKGLKLLHARSEPADVFVVGSV